MTILLQRLSEVIPELSASSPFGNAPTLDLDQFTEQLEEQLEVSGLAIRIDEQDWKEQVRKGFGRNVLSIALSVTPIGQVLWMMSYEDMAKLSSWMMKPGSRTKSLHSEILQEGFYRYLLLEALRVLQQMAPFDALSLQMSDEEVEIESGYCIDVEVKLDRRSCWARVIVPEEFQKRWIEHFSKMPQEFRSNDFSKNFAMQLGVQIGSVALNEEELKKITPGDFVALDQSNFDVDQQVGSGVLTYQLLPLFHVQIRGDEIKIKEPVVHEQNPLIEDGKKISVEIAKIHMTLDELMNLNLEQDLKIMDGIEESVALVVDGEKIGTAELIYLGEKLGLRILEIREIL